MIKLKNLYTKYMSDQRGSYSLLVSLICAMMMSIILTPTIYGGIVAMNQAQSSDTIYSITSSYAKTKYAELERAPYANVTAEAKTAVAVAGTNYNFEREVLVTEQDLGGGLKQKNVTINMYNSGETSPIFTLPLTLSSQGSGSSVPIGTVIYFATSTPPVGFLECDGTVLNSSTYPALVSLLGTTFGTYGQLPDLRGEFIRGWTHTRTGTTDDLRIFGSWQIDIFKSHQHNETGGLGTGGNLLNLSAVNSTSSIQVPWNNLTTPTGGVETRPRNLALLPCIKY